MDAYLSGAQNFAAHCTAGQHATGTGKEFLDNFTRYVDNLGRSSWATLENGLLQLADPSFTIGNLGLLAAKSRSTELGNHLDGFLDQLSTFLAAAEPKQLRLAPLILVELCTKLSEALLARGIPFKGIVLMMAAVQKLQAHPRQLTSIHALLMELCLSAKCLETAEMFIIDDIGTGSFGPELSHDEREANLQYVYNCGCVCAKMKNFDRSIQFFQICITAPGVSMASLRLEAYKKYLLTSLIYNGEIVTPDSGNEIFKVLKPNATAYVDIATAFVTYNPVELNNVITKHQDSIMRDKNEELSKWVREVQSAVLIIKEEKERRGVPFSLEDLTSRAQRTGGPTEAEEDMILDDEILEEDDEKDEIAEFWDSRNVMPNVDHGARALFLNPAYEAVFKRLDHRTANVGKGSRQYSTSRKLIQEDLDIARFYKNMAPPFHLINENDDYDRVDGIYKCKICIFKTKTALLIKSHIRGRHMPIEKLKCPLCPKEFSLKHNLTRHLKRAHIPLQAGSTVFIEGKTPVDGKMNRCLIPIKFGGVGVTTGMELLSQLYAIIWRDTKGKLDNVSVCVTTFKDIMVAAKQRLKDNKGASKLATNGVRETTACSFAYRMANGWTFDPKEAVKLDIFAGNRGAGNTLKWLTRVMTKSFCANTYEQLASMRTVECEKIILGLLKKKIPLLPTKTQQAINSYVPFSYVPALILATPRVTQLISTTANMDENDEGVTSQLVQVTSAEGTKVVEAELAPELTVNSSVATVVQTPTPPLTATTFSSTVQTGSPARLPSASSMVHNLPANMAGTASNILLQSRGARNASTQPRSEMTRYRSPVQVQGPGGILIVNTPTLLKTGVSVPAPQPQQTSQPPNQVQTASQQFTNGQALANVASTTKKIAQQRGSNIILVQTTSASSTAATPPQQQSQQQPQQQQQQPPVKQPGQGGPVSIAGQQVNHSSQQILQPVKSSQGMTMVVAGTSRVQSLQAGGKMPTILKIVNTAGQGTPVSRPDGTFIATNQQGQAFVLTTMGQSTSSTQDPNAVRTTQAGASVGAPRFPCPDCGKEFKRKDHLTRHSASVHAGTKYTCPNCGLQVSTKDHLNRHIQRKHQPALAQSQSGGQPNPTSSTPAARGKIGVKRGSVDSSDVVSTIPTKKSFST